MVRISLATFKISMLFCFVNHKIIIHRLLILMNIVAVHAQGLNVTGGRRGRRGGGGGGGAVGD